MINQHNMSGLTYTIYLDSDTYDIKGPIIYFFDGRSPKLALEINQAPLYEKE